MPFETYAGVFAHEYTLQTKKKNRISCLNTKEVRFFKIVASVPVDVRR